MDSTTESLVDYVLTLDAGMVTEPAMRAAKRLLLDSLGCAVAAIDTRAGNALLGVAAQRTGDPSARVIGLTSSTSVDWAAFVNTALIRYLDWNDAPPLSQHPSDNFGHILAVADAYGSSGSEVLRTAILAYEIEEAINPGVERRSRAWDDAPLVAIIAACCAGRLTELRADQLAHAIGIAAVSNIALRATKKGQLSMWKGIATAHGARSGVFAAELAGCDFTGPSEPFDGRYGFWETIADSWDPEVLSSGARPFAIERSTMKFFPACNSGQSSIWAARELHSQVPSIDDIAEVRVQTYLRSFLNMAGDQEKWHPTSHETADHSLPFVVAATLARGTVAPEDYTPEGLQDPAIRKLMPLIKVLPSEEMTQAFPRSVPARVEVILRDGKRLIAEVTDRKGHHANPMTDEELHEKFASIVAPQLGDERCDRLIECVETLEEASSLEEIFSSLTPQRLGPALSAFSSQTVEDAT